MPKIRKIRSLHIFAISPKKTWPMTFFFFLSPDKYKGFYKVVVSFWVCVISLAQSTPKKNTLKREEWSWFFACRKTSKISLSWYHHFRYAWPGMPKLPKIKCFLFLYNTLRKRLVMRLIFYMQITMKVNYKFIQWFLMGMIKHSQSLQNSKFAMSLQ